MGWGLIGRGDTGAPIRLRFNHPSIKGNEWTWPRRAIAGTCQRQRHLLASSWCQSGKARPHPRTWPVAGVASVLHSIAHLSKAVNLLPSFTAAAAARSLPPIQHIYRRHSLVVHACTIPLPAAARQAHTYFNSTRAVLDHCLDACSHEHSLGNLPVAPASTLSHRLA